MLVVESVAPAEEVADEEPAAPAAVSEEKHTEVSAVEEKHENGAADAEEKARTPIKMFTVQISHLQNGKLVTADTAISGVGEFCAFFFSLENASGDS